MWGVFSSRITCSRESLPFMLRLAVIRIIWLAWAYRQTTRSSLVTANPTSSNRIKRIEIKSSQPLAARPPARTRECPRKLWSTRKFGLADLRYESSFVGFLKPRPKLTFGWVQDCHSSLDSATPLILCVISLTYYISDQSLCPLCLCGSFHSLASRTVS